MDGPKLSEGQCIIEWSISQGGREHLYLSICIEPNLEVDSDKEPETGGMQETEQT